MNTAHYISLTPFDLLLAIGLIVIAAAISTALKLGLTRSLGLAALRCMLQLGAMGLILKKIFQINTPLLVMAWLLIMLLFAGREAVRRSKTKYSGINLDALVTMTVSSLVAGGLVTQMVLRVHPWYDPQYVIPIFGMVFGNSLNGICLCLDRLTEYVKSRGMEIELMLTFGATRAEAVREGARQAVRTGMIPIINNMTVAGIVSLPGMMTGQIVAGASPMQAVAYQIVIMFMIAAANALGSMSIATLAGRRLVTDFGLQFQRHEKP